MTAPEAARAGAGEPCAWFSYLWAGYVPGSRAPRRQELTPMCRRCGHVAPRDLAPRVCGGQVRVTLRGGA